MVCVCVCVCQTPGTQKQGDIVKPQLATIAEQNIGSKGSLRNFAYAYKS